VAKKEVDDRRDQGERVRPWTEVEDRKLIAAYDRVGHDREQLEKSIRLHTWGSIQGRIKKFIAAGKLVANTIYEKPEKPAREYREDRADSGGEEGGGGGGGGGSGGGAGDGGKKRRRPQVRATETPEALRSDQTSVEIWAAALQMKAEKRDRERSVHGFKMRYICREDDTTTKGDLYIWPPGAPSANGAFASERINHGSVIRSLSMLRDVLVQRIEDRRAGRTFMMLTKKDLVEVEAADAEGGAPSWRLAEVRKSLPDGRFQVCIFDASGKPDEAFLEWYSRTDLGKEWRRHDPAVSGLRDCRPKAVARAAKPPREQREGSRRSSRNPGQYGDDDEEEDAVRKLEVFDQEHPDGHYEDAPLSKRCK
jgi:hypothetical protein